MLHLIPYEFWHLLRWFNMVLSLVAMTGVLLEARTYWRDVYCNKERMTLVALLVASFAIGYTNFEGNLQHNPGGPRIWFQCAALILVIIRNIMDLHRVQINADQKHWQDWLNDDRDGGEKNAGTS